MPTHLNSKEFRDLLEFFAQKVPVLILQVCGISDSSFKNNKSFKKIYGKTNTKAQGLMKSFASNFKILLE